MYAGLKLVLFRKTAASKYVSSFPFAPSSRKGEALSGTVTQVAFGFMRSLRLAGMTIRWLTPRQRA